MHKIRRCTSGGYDLEALAYKPQEYYYFEGQSPDPLQAAIWTLSVGGDTEAFKKEFHLEKILHLSLGPCGTHQFTIENDKFTFRLGQSMEELHEIS